MLTSMTAIHRNDFKGLRKYLGGHMSLHTAGGILALVDETGKSRIELLEEFANEGMRRLHPEWYEDGFQHPLEIEAELEEAERYAAKMAQAHAEAVAAAQEVRARANAA